MDRFLTLIVCSFICASAYADLQQSHLLGKENKEPAAGAAYWTSERLQSAKPMPLPEVSPTDAKKILTPQKSVGEGEGEDGAPPKTNRTHLKNLFTPNSLSTNTLLKTFDRGSYRRDFSSSQLIPLNADRTYPYRAVGKLFFTIPNEGDYVCSAAVIKPRIVLTAGHCVHRGSGGEDGFYTNWVFIPAFRDGKAPYESWNWTYVSVASGWASGNGDVPNEDDYGMLEFEDKNIDGVKEKIGNITGYLGYQTYALIPNHAHLLGYPCNFDSCQKMHQVTAQSARSVAPNNVEYGSDMRGGSSGGPWVQNFGKFSAGQSGGDNAGLNRVIGVTSWGYVSGAPLVQGASNFDGHFTELLTKMCAHQTDNC